MKQIRLGISRCLLGDEVRFDGGHKRDPFLTDVLGRFVEWVPVCPEVEAGLGTPREAMRLVGHPDTPRLITIKSRADHTRVVQQLSGRRVGELETADLSGYVFKKDSPSCGMERVRIYNRHGMPSRTTRGIFAGAFMHRFPLIPVEEEGRLNNPVLRENFIERVFAYRRWQDLMAGPVTRRAVIQFHTRHKYLLLAHSQPHYTALGRLVAHAKQHGPHDLGTRYGALFMETLSVKATPRKHVNVLQHMAAYFKKALNAIEKEELQGVIEDYHRGLTPLIVPITLIRHYVRALEVSYLADQIYLNPHPKELMLRNRV